MTIRLGTVFGKRLNLNGDQGNLLVLRKYLSAAGYEVEIVPVDSTETALSCHFVILGHGSMAAWASIEARVAELDWKRIAHKVPTLAVASAAYLLEGQSIDSFFENSNRISEFVAATLKPASGDFQLPADFEILGYRNTPDGALPNLANPDGKLLITMLHGPILAKNPRLLHHVFLEILATAGNPAPTSDGLGLAAWQETLNGIAARIWAVEAEGHEYPEL